MNEHLKGLPLQQTHWLSLEAASELDILYVGLLEGRVRVFGQECHASILVIKDTACSLTGARRRRTPALLGMNILQQVLPASQKTLQGLLPPPLPLVEATVRETTLRCGTLVGLARVAGTTHVPALSMATVRVSGARRRTLVAEPCHHPLPSGLMLIPTLVGGNRSLYHVRVANLTSEDVVLQGCTPIAALHAVDSVDSNITLYVSSQELHVGVQEPEPLPNPDLGTKLQNFKGSAEEKQQLLDLPLSYPNTISRDDMKQPPFSLFPHTGIAQACELIVTLQI